MNISKAISKAIRDPGSEKASPTCSGSDDEIDILNLVPEDDYGPREYKYRLIDLSEEQIKRLSGQMHHRLTQGSDQCWYNIGLLDDGFPLGMTKKETDESLRNLKVIAEVADATICQQICQPIKYRCADTVEDLQKIFLYHRRPHNEGDPFTADHKRKLVKKMSSDKHPEIIMYVIEVLIRRKVNEETGGYARGSLGTIGNVDAGKSTLVGRYCKGITDDGDGLARAGVFNHAHESSRGQTSSESVEIMGFTEDGKLVNSNTSAHGDLSWSDIVLGSDKVWLWHDLAGHEKYLKTTMGGVIANLPDYLVLVISASDGIRGMTAEHIYLANSLKIPFFIVITKTDVTLDSTIDKNVKRIKKLFKNKEVLVIEDMTQIKRASSLVAGRSVIPLFKVSNVTGEGHNFLEPFLNILPVRNIFAKKVDEPVEYRIFRNYVIKGVGLVVYGKLMSGTVSVGQKLLVGPFTDNTYKETTVRSIEVHRRKVKTAFAGDEVCLGIPSLLSTHGLQRGAVKAGLYAVDASVVTKNKGEIASEQAYYDTERSKVTTQITTHQTALSKKHVDESIKTSLRKKIRFLTTQLSTISSIANQWRCCWEFKAELLISKSLGRSKDGSMQKAGSAKAGYQPVAHIGAMRQAVILLHFELVKSKHKSKAKQKRTIECLQPGDKAIVCMRLAYYPSWFKVGDRFMIRERSTRGKGVITEVSTIRHTSLVTKTKHLRLRPSHFGTTRGPQMVTKGKTSQKSVAPPNPPKKKTVAPPPLPKTSNT